MFSAVSPSAGPTATECRHPYPRLWGSAEHRISHRAGYPGGYPHPTLMEIEMAGRLKPSEYGGAPTDGKIELPMRLGVEGIQPDPHTPTADEQLRLLYRVEAENDAPA